jgi:hypothetical protein
MFVDRAVCNAGVHRHAADGRDRPYVIEHGLAIADPDLADPDLVARTRVKSGRGLRSGR